MISDRFRELFETLRTAKIRTAVTALSVAWGIFMLVILLGAGKGVQNGAEHEFRDKATNSLFIYRGTTSIPFEGHRIGRNVNIDTDDFDAIHRNVDGIDHISGRYYLQGEYRVSYKSNVSSFDVRAVHPDHLWLEQTIVLTGRFIDDLDLKERRKVVVIGPVAIQRLFKGRDPLGEWINIRGTMYRVVGTFTDEGDEDELAKLYIPITTAQMVDGSSKRIHQLMFTLGDATTEESEVRATETTRILARRHHFSPDDTRAIHIRNNLEDFSRVVALFSRIRLFIWIVGIGTIIAGIVGVSNIMLISVRERTKEIGIKKALGATPWTIISQILLEALVVTGTSGWLGMVSGVGLLEIVRTKIPPTDFFRDPEADLAVVLGATALLVFSGLLAGYFPARLAARVNPIVALRAD